MRVMDAVRETFTLESILTHESILLAFQSQTRFHSGYFLSEIEAQEWLFI